MNTPAEIATLYGSYIHNVARCILCGDADAEDVVQDVMKIVLLKVHTFRGHSDIKTWLYRVTFNVALAAHKKIARRQKRCCSGGKLNGQTCERPVDKEMLAEEEKMLIQNAVSLLPDDYKQVLVMSHFDDMTNEQIGQKLGLSVPAVKSRLHRARYRMRKLLQYYY